MSNALTSTFITALGLAGSRLADTDGRRRLIYWILEHDQSARGAGTVGFALTEMPFDIDAFEAQRAFVVRAATAAEARLGWETLDDEPDLEVLEPHITGFVDLLHTLQKSDLNPLAKVEWLAESESEEPLFHGFPQCPEHAILMTAHGCHACNNR